MVAAARWIVVGGGLLLFALIATQVSPADGAGPEASAPLPATTPIGRR